MRRLLRFVVVGTVGFAIDAGLVWMLTKYGFSPFIARVPAISVAIVVTWILNRTHTFQVTRPKTTSEALRYALVALASAGLNFMLYSSLVLIGVPPVLAVALATGALMFLSFFSYHRLVFTEDR